MKPFEQSATSFRFMQINSRTYFVRYNRHLPQPSRAQFYYACRRWDKLHNWLRNLANLAPEVLDGALLWAEQCLRQPHSQGREAVEYLLRLGPSSLPFLAEPTGYTLRQAEDFLLNPELQDLHEQIGGIHKRLGRAVGMFRTGGLFATFAGPVTELSLSFSVPLGQGAP
jgi:hypothetical protein